MNDILAQRFSIAGPLVVKPKIFRDHRGFFSETFVARELHQIGISGEFVQDNHSMSLEVGVVRGLHFQCPPHDQDKLVRVTRGAIFDVAVDLRGQSPTFGQHVSVILTAENWLQLWIPKGFAHGFCTLEPHTEVIYKVTEYYRPQSEKGLLWNDPQLKINWPTTQSKAILSEKDQSFPKLSEIPIYFSAL